jgi:hypothetical protein
MYVTGDKMNIRILLAPLVAILLLTGCNLFSTPDKDRGQILFFTADSTGTERYSFNVNEPIFIHFAIVNPTNHDLRYKKYPYMGDSELFNYGIFAPGTDGDDVIGYPPDHLQDAILPKHESRVQVYRIDNLEANYYKIKLQILIFLNPDDFVENCKNEIFLTVQELR